MDSYLEIGCGLSKDTKISPKRDTFPLNFVVENINNREKFDYPLSNDIYLLWSCC